MATTATLDIENADQLTDYLRSTGRIAAGESPVVTSLAGGVSNRTVLVARPTGEDWVIKQALGKLRVHVDWFSSPERIQREALALRWLPTLSSPDSVARYIFEDPEFHLLAMQAVPQPHENWKTMLLSGDLRSHHVVQFATLLATIHETAYSRHAEIEPVFADRSFFQSLRLEPYYRYTADHVPAARHFLHRLIDDTLSQSVTLVHGDYSPKNVLVHQDRLILLDHEVIHFGDPAFDVGFSLTHFLSKANHLIAMRQPYIAAAHGYWNTYRAALQNVPWLSTLEEGAVRHTLACLLARIDGRSPLEYLDMAERTRQRRSVLNLILQQPSSVDRLIDRFATELSRQVLPLL